MSRLGYSNDIDYWSLIRWRGAVASAVRGRRGQAFLREMLASLDALPEHRLIAHDGEVCALGAVGRARGMPMADIDPEDHETVAAKFGVAHALACEVMWINDELSNSPERRWATVRDWIIERLEE